MTEYKSPELINEFSNKPSLFLAGSIEMGIAEEWQKRVVEALEEYEVDIFNPRRDNWDSSWIQSKDNPVFKEQVTWELDCITDCDIVLFYFDPNTKSPITLLELGYILGLNDTTHIVVVCPEGFYRKGNIDIICERNWWVDQFEDLNEAIEFIKDTKLVKIKNYASNT